MKVEKKEILYITIVILFIIFFILEIFGGSLLPETNIYYYKDENYEVIEPGREYIFRLKITEKGGFREHDYEIKNLKTNLESWDYEISEKKFTVKSDETKIIYFTLRKIDNSTDNIRIFLSFMLMRYSKPMGHSGTGEQFVLFNETLKESKFEQIDHIIDRNIGNLQYNIGIIILAIFSLSYLFLILVFMANIVKSIRNKIEKRKT